VARWRPRLCIVHNSNKKPVIFSSSPDRIKKMGKWGACCSVLPCGLEYVWEMKAFGGGGCIWGWDLKTHAYVMN